MGFAATKRKGLLIHKQGVFAQTVNRPVVVILVICSMAYFIVNSSGKPDPSLMLGIVEKQDSVAWMLHMPHSPKTISKWNKQNW